MHGANFTIIGIVKKVAQIGRRIDLWEGGFGGTEGRGRLKMRGGRKTLRELVWRDKSIQKIDRRMKKMERKMARTERDGSIKKGEVRKGGKKL